MKVNISLKPSDFISIKGRINRLNFLIVLLIIFFVFTALYYLVMPFARKTEDVVIVLSTIVMMQFLSLIALTPIFIKRFHDLNSSGYWALIFWVSFIISVEPAVLINELYGILINPFSIYSVFIHIVSLLALAVLFFKKGNPENNLWGSPNNKLNLDSGADAPSPVN